jgi:hypothetical protein
MVERRADASHEERQLRLRENDALLDVITQVCAREEVHDEIAAGAKRKERRNYVSLVETS